MEGEDRVRFIHRLNKVVAIFQTSRGKGEREGGVLLPGEK